jgi:hypothetical protein
MSAAVPVPLRKVLVVDPLCDQSVESVFAIEKSASIQNFYNISSTNKSSSSISWTVNCNSENTITDRVWLLDVTGTFTIPFAAKPTVTSNIALRPNALSLCATSIVLQQGNSSSSIQSSQIASALQRYGFYDKYLNYSEANPDLDMTTPYVDGAGVFAPLSDIVGGKYQGRVGTSAIISSNYNAAGTLLTLTVRFLEPVLIPPLLSGLEQRKEGLRRISQYQLTYNFGAFERAFSAVFEDAKQINGRIGVNFGDCRLNLLQVIPSPLDVGRSLSVQSLPYDEFVAFVSDTANLAVSPVNAIVGGTAQFSSSVIQVSRIPEAIYIYCRPTDAFLNATGGSYATDTFAQYVSNSLSVNFNGVNQFQNCSDISLYRICRQNGLNTPWTQFNCSGISSIAYDGQTGVGTISYDSGVGAVICLKLSKDITLDASLAPSVNTKVNMQIQCTFGNPYSKIAEAGNPYNVDEVPFAMYTVVHYSGVQETYASNTVATTIGALTVDDVLTATKRNERVHYDVIDDNVFGGASFLDKAKKFLKEGRLANALKQLKSYFSHPLTKEIGKTAKEYLRGREGAEEGSSQAADFIEELGLGMSGGRKMTKAQLKRALL